MKDPVTAMTGISYDRESIEQWLMTAKNCTCPVTKQPLPRDSDLTQNHTLRRLIQAWCSENGVDRIPTPRPPLEKTHFQKLIRDLDVPQFHQSTLEKMHALASENERNRRYMAEAGVANAMVPLIIKSFKQGNTSSLEEALIILRLLWSEPTLKLLINENSDFINSLTWILQHHLDDNVKLVNEAMPILNSAIEISNSTLLSNLKLEFFKEITRVLRRRAVSQQALKSALHALIETCPLGRNRIKIVEAGAVFDLIELELEKPEKNITELIFILLAQLCSCADGREQFLKHAAGIAMLSKRILRVSPTTDDRAVHTLALIAKCSASMVFVKEMLRVGAVSKLCMVMQADCASYLKESARQILKLHSKTWNDSPCIQLYLLTRDQR
ncbi:hypothetical protein L6164_022173 [Bauhinia variegata]|nr:hypothetical protein L6164_022173 [Bauhinia variegata]